MTLQVTLPLGRPGPAPLNPFNRPAASALHRPEMPSGDGFTLLSGRKPRFAGASAPTEAPDQETYRKTLRESVLLLKGDVSPAFADLVADTLSRFPREDVELLREKRFRFSCGPTIDVALPDYTQKPVSTR